MPAKRAPATLSDLLSETGLLGQNWAYVELRGNQGFSVPPSSDVLLHAVLEGEVRFTLSSQPTRTLGPGMAAMVLSGQAHAVRAHAESPADLLRALPQDAGPDAPPTVSIGEGETTARLLCARLHLRIPKAWDRRALPAVVFPGIDYDAGETLNIGRARALDSNARKAGGTAHLTKLASSMLIGALSSSPYSDPLLRLETEASPINRAIHMMLAAPAKDWSVARLAQAVGMKRSSFAAEFTATIGVPPMKMLANRRLELAADLLRETPLTIAEICARVGYGSEAAFSRKFTRHYGRPPSRARDQGSAAKKS